MHTNKFRPRRLVMILILLVTVAGLLGGFARQQVRQGGDSRIPDTSTKATAPAAEKLPIVTVLPQQAAPSTAQPFKQYTKPPQAAAPRATAVVRQPTATVQVKKVEPACLVGTWQVANLPGAMSQSFAQSGSTMRLQSVAGQASYVFDANSSMTIAFDHLATTFTGTVENRDVTVLQGLDGSGTAHYQVDPAKGELVLSDFGGQGLLTTLDINGQRLAEGNIPVWQAFTSSLAADNADPNTPVDFSRVSVTCRGDSMTLQAVEPAAGPPVTLNREK